MINMQENKINPRHKNSEERRKRDFMIMKGLWEDDKLCNEFYSYANKYFPELCTETEDYISKGKNYGPLYQVKIRRRLILVWKKQKGWVHQDKRNEPYSLCFDKILPDSNEDIGDRVLDEFQKEFLECGILIMENGKPVLDLLNNKDPLYS